MIACSLKKSDNSNTIDLGYAGYTASFYSSIKEVQTEWNTIAGANLFTHSNFLSALEEAPPSGTSYRYSIIHKDGTNIGVVYFQLKVINLLKSLRLDVYKSKGIIDFVWHSIKKMLASPLKSKVLVCGNMTLTGSNGHFFLPQISDEDQSQIILHTIEEMISFLKKEKLTPRAVLIKDFYQDNKPGFNNNAYTEFSVQPNMILDIDSSWNTFEDYIGAMKTKYRTRVKRARKKSASLSHRVLELEEIHAHSADISRLYKNVADQAGFNLFILPNNYFYSLQKHLKDKMKVVGYFDGDKMVGFYTHILNHGDLDAHFLGYDPQCNRNCQLYLNMLYDLVDAAITLNANKLIMSRTAMEIKSSAGALGHDMVLYMKTTNAILNKGVAKALSYFSPEANWKPRTPFK